MTHTTGHAAMASVPVALVDVLNSLLEAELHSVFRYLADDSPYFDRSTAEVRRPLMAMIAANGRHCRELADLIASLGGSPFPRRAFVCEEQFLAYLSLKFLLPKLATAKELTIERYRNALATTIGPTGVRAVLERHLVEHETDLALLRRAAADSRTANGPPNHTP